MPEQRKRYVRVWVIGFVALAIIAALGVILATRPKTANDDIQGVVPPTYTPLPSPTGNGGSAQWSVSDRSFQSKFPKGFSFSVRASSTGGKIVEAAVWWRHAAGYRKHANGIIDASGNIMAIWRATSSDNVPQWVGVEYWWSFKDEKGNTYETDHQYTEYADNSRAWKRAESEDIIVFWEASLPDEIGQQTIDAMRQQRPFYLKNWGKLLAYRPRAIIYANKASFGEWMIAAGQGFIGTTNADWGGTAQVYVPKYGIKDVAYATVLHEIGHLYQSNTVGLFQRDWFYEGDATYFEMIPTYDYMAKVKAMAAEGILPSLENGGPPVDGKNARDGYDIGYAFWVWLAKTYGPDAHLKVWTLMANGKFPGSALEIVTGKKFIDMETDFRTWLGAMNPEAPTPIPTDVFDFPPTPTYEPTLAPSS